jgi:hypothetical protein
MKTIFSIMFMFFMFMNSGMASILTSDSVNNGWQPYSNIYSLLSSADGAGRSYRHFLEGTGVFTGHPQSPGQQLDFWGTSSGDFKPDSDGSYFTENSFPNQGQATMLIEIAGWRNINWLGYYEVDNPGTLYTIFNGAAQANPSNGNFTSTPLTANFTVNGDWAMVFMPNFHSTNTPTWAQVLASGFFQNGSGASQFVINRDFVNQLYYVGIEDTLEGDRDANDLILRIKNTEAEDPGGDIPEPSTYALLGAGLMTLFYLRRKR